MDDDELKRVKEERSKLRRALREENAKRVALEADVVAKEETIRDQTQQLDKLSYDNDRVSARLKQVLRQLEEAQEQRSNAITGGSVLSSLINTATGTSSELERLSKQIKVLEQELEIKIKETVSIHMQMFELRQEHKSELAQVQQVVEDQTSTIADMKQSFQSTQDAYDQLQVDFRSSSDALRLSQACCSNLQEQMVKRIESCCANRVKQMEHMVGIPGAPGESTVDARMRIVRLLGLLQTCFSEWSQNARKWGFVERALVCVDQFAECFASFVRTAVELVKLQRTASHSRLGPVGARFYQELKAMVRTHAKLGSFAFEHPELESHVQVQPLLNELVDAFQNEGTFALETLRVDILVEKLVLIATTFEAAPNRVALPDMVPSSDDRGDILFRASPSEAVDNPPRTCQLGVHVLSAPLLDISWVLRSLVEALGAISQRKHAAAVGLSSTTESFLDDFRAQQTPVYISQAKARDALEQIERKTQELNDMQLEKKRGEIATQDLRRRLKEREIEIKAREAEREKLTPEQAPGSRASEGPSAGVVDCAAEEETDEQDSVNVSSTSFDAPRTQAGIFDAGRERTWVAKQEQLTMQLREADAKFREVYSKYKDTINQMTSLAQEHKRHMRQKLQWRTAMKRAREELDATRTSYDGQLKALTEQACQFEAECRTKDADINKLKEEVKLLEQLKNQQFFRG